MPCSDDFLRPTNLKVAPPRTLLKQQRELTKLLLLWPELSNNIAAKFIAQTMGVKMTWVCLQQARKSIGLDEPSHNTKTRQKRTFAEYVVASMLDVGHDEPDKMIRTVRKQLEHHFYESTNNLLIKTWVQDCLDRNRGFERTSEYVASAKQELIDLGFKEPESRQFKLL